MIRVGVLTIDMQITNGSSLKDKRAVLRRMKDRLKNTFNVSVSEVNNNDKWQRATIGIAAISNDKTHLEATLNKVRDFVERDKNIVVLECTTEVI